MFGFKARRIAKIEAKWEAEKIENDRRRAEFFTGMTHEEEINFVTSEAVHTAAYWATK